MSGRHEILIAEDDPAFARTLVDLVRSMDMDCRVAATLEETRAALAERLPCALLQDMQMPHAAGAEPHEKSGETSIRALHALSSGPRRVPIVVVTAFRSDPDYVWAMSELEAEGFCAKSNLAGLPEKLIGALRKRGREDHGRCAGCNEESRAEAGAADAPRIGEAILYAHDRRGVAIDASDVAALIERRAEHDLFLDCATLDRRGRRAGHRDHAGVFRETFLTETSALVLAEIVQARRPVRADAIARLRGASHASAVRTVQQARRAVDVHLLTRGKESRNEWRAIRTIGGKRAAAFFFDPPAAFRYAVLVAAVQGG